MSSTRFARKFQILAGLGSAGILLAAVGLAPSEQDRTEPRYTSQNELARPEGYREWVFVGSGLGMGYTEEEVGYNVPHFTNIYLQPEAYRQFAATGSFPDKTVLVMEVVSAGSKSSINQRGQFEDRFLGIQAAVKDEQRFKEKWAYFTFIGPGGEALAMAKPFPKEACWTCHHEHGAVDNVFVQFYPVLRAARKSNSTAKTAP